jgi:hypothetical protein
VSDEPDFERVAAVVIRVGMRRVQRDLNNGSGAGTLAAPEGAAVDKDGTDGGGDDADGGVLPGLD